MAGQTDKTVALLQTLAGLSAGATGLSARAGATGLHLVEVKTSDPDPVTLVMRGTKRALGLDIFEVPVDCYPLREGDKLLAYPIVGSAGGSSRWAILAKLTGGLVMATMKSASTCQPDGMQALYQVTAPAFFPVANTASSGYLVAADIRPLQDGDRVSIAPTWDGEAVGYVVLNRY